MKKRELVSLIRTLVEESTMPNESTMASTEKMYLQLDLIIKAMETGEDAHGKIEDTINEVKGQNSTSAFEGATEAVYDKIAQLQATIEAWQDARSELKEGSYGSN